MRGSSLTCKPTAITRWILTIALTGLVVAEASFLSAAEPGLDLFEKKIRPVLVQHCYECHSTKSKIVQANLLLDSREGTRKGGDSGPSVVPGKPDESLLLDALRYDGLEMPPRGKLPESVIADFKKWIELGAPDPREAPAVTRPAATGTTSIEEGRKFWSFQQPRRSPLPSVKDAGWPRSRIDRFLLAKLESKGLKPARDAAPEVLLRRVTFDLVGLPPSPETIDEYLRNPTPEAFAKYVDKLLASPQFGERWGRHWLDVARFAESSGGGRSMIFPDAWRYRDYVIQSFNEDKPYDQFLIEQIAGDLLPAETDDDRERFLVATGFLAIGPTNYECQDKDILEMDVIDEQLDTIGRTILGMTIGCARCHDHKFDPIPTKDYYALAGILKSTQTMVHDNVSRWVELPLPMSSDLAAKVSAHEMEVAALRRRIERAKSVAKSGTDGKPVSVGVVEAKNLPGLVVDDKQAKRVGPWKESTYSGNYIGEGYLYDDRSQGGDKTLTFVPEFPTEGRYEVRLAYVAHPNRSNHVPVNILHADGETTQHVDQQKPPELHGRFVSLGKYRFDRNGQWFVLVSNEGTKGHVAVDAVQFLPVQAEDETAAVAEIPERTGDPEPDLKALESELKRLNERAPKRPLAMGVKNALKTGDTWICIRGNLTNKGETAPRGFLRATLSPSQVANPPVGWVISDRESGRLQMARWLADPSNPLTARVMVNRIWHHLFGAGIVRTTDLFGTTGEPPSHPELLDDLAIQFQAPSEIGDEDRTDAAGDPAKAWSVKSMIRRIVLSRAYQMASEVSVPASGNSSTDPLRIDPDNRLLSRQNRRRLDAESLRDAMLTAARTIDLEVGGPTLKAGPEGEYGYQFTDVRRSVYTPVLRNRLHELFEVFDVADPNLVTGRRNVSTVPTQALFLMNSPFILSLSETAASRNREAKEGSPSLAIEQAYRHSLGRRPTSRELLAAEKFLASAGNDPKDRARAWSLFYQSLFASIDFRYLK